MRVEEVIAPPFSASGTITLDETARHRRRFQMTADDGSTFLLDLPEARLLKHGEGLLLEDGRIFEVRAIPEDLYRVTANSPRHLVALAWQIGNRHLQAEISEDQIIIRRDHVIKEMLLGLGAEVTEITAPFSPEAGAYSSGSSGHGNHHHHDHD